MPYKLMDTLQSSGNWGVVRVIPDRLSEMDVWVDAEILKSDGASLALQVTVEDASGRRWFTKKYEETASKYSYDPTIASRAEPFQKLYNQIANDMLAYRQQYDGNEIRAMRVISELKFARDFAPDFFNDHLARDDRGRYQIKRLPAVNDPILRQVRQMRERDYVFVDTLQAFTLLLSIRWRRRTGSGARPTIWSRRPCERSDPRPTAGWWAAPWRCVGGDLGPGG